MMRVAGAFSKQAREPMRQTVIVKGDRMVSLTADTTYITDLGKETITDINFKNRTYSVITFAQMRQALAQHQEKMKSQKTQEGADRADVDFKASVKETGQTRVISGLTAKEVIMILEMQVKDRESGKAGAMDVVSDLWLAPQIPGYDQSCSLNHLDAPFLLEISGLQKLGCGPAQAFEAARGPVAGRARRGLVFLDGLLLPRRGCLC